MAEIPGSDTYFMEQIAERDAEIENLKQEISAVRFLVKIAMESMGRLKKREAALLAFVEAYDSNRSWESLLQAREKLRGVIDDT